MISLRLRLALSFGVLSWVVVAASGTVLYFGTSHTLESSFRREMSNTAKVLHHRVNEDHEPIDKELLDVGEHMSVRVLDAVGATLLESEGLSSKLAFHWIPRATEDEVWCEDPHLLRMGYRLIGIRMPRGWILVFGSMHTERAVLKQFRHGFYVIQAIAPLLAGFLGYLALGLGLSPLRRLTEQARHIRPSNLGQPLVLETLPKELWGLGTALNESMASLAQAFAQLAELNGDLAHELRTPLHALRMELEGILETLPHDSPFEDRLVAAVECVDHLRRVISQMLHLARTEDPSVALRIHPLEAEAFLDQAVMPFLPMAEERGMSLTHAAPRGFFLSGDGTLLRRAVHNLLGNALRYGRDSGIVSVRIYPDGAGAILEVEDDGPGMNPADLAKVGRRFLRMEGARERSKGGTGLGLAIVQGIAERHGGRMELHTPSGGGLLARLVLPDTKPKSLPE